MMVLTILEAHVVPECATELTAAFDSAIGHPPPQLVSTQLVRSTADPTLWRLQTIWRSREALDEMRRTGTPAGVLMFRAAGAEPTLSIFDVERELSPASRA